MDNKKAAFKQPERTKNTPKKEGFVFSFVKPFPEAAKVPLPPETEDDLGPEKLFNKQFEIKPNYDQDLGNKFFAEEEEVRQGEGTDPPQSYSVVSLYGPKLIPLSLGQSALVRSNENFWDESWQLFM